MKRVLVPAIILTIFAFALAAEAQKNDDNRENEFGFTIGGELIPDPSTKTSPSAPINIGSSIAYQLHYAHRLWKGDKAALFFEVPATAAPSHDVSSPNPATPVRLATFYVTPSFRLNLRPLSGLSPWFSFGGGYGLYEGSEWLENGLTNFNRYSGTGALQWGVGADFRTPFKIIFPISLRGEVRDSYTLDTLNFNNPVARTTQHNVVAGGGLFWRF
jgi:hypothetical protein